jgi:hypothetical protein
MFPFRSVVRSFVFALLVPSIAATSCACYTTNSTDADGTTSTQTYTNYTFIDFRSLSGLSSPSVTVNDTQDDGSGNITMPYLSSPDITNVFALQNWTNSPAGGNASTVELVNSPQNVYICEMKFWFTSQPAPSEFVPTRARK